MSTTVYLLLFGGYIAYNVVNVLLACFMNDPGPYVHVPPSEFEKLTWAYMRDEIDGFDYSFKVEVL